MAGAGRVRGWWTPRRHRPLVGLALVLALGMLAGPGRADEPTGEEIERIEAALPSKATVAPDRPRRVLIFTRCAGFRHGSIPYGVAALTRMGRRTGAFDAVVSEDPAMFEQASLAGFDAVVFLNSTGTLFDDARLRENLLEFVRSGHGLAGIHAATDCFYDWPAFGEMIGGYFDNHPWNEQVTITVEEPDHPLCRAFSGEAFVVADEIYQFKPPYAREHLRVLLSLDTTRTDMTKGGIHRDDGDFAVSWVRSFGDGRVFYCSLGHRNEIYWNPAVLRHYLDGIQFALGDLEADTTPGRARPEPPMSLDEALEAAAAYTLGASRRPLSTIADEMTASLGDATRREAIERRLLTLFTDPRATIEGRAFACRQLAIVGGEQSVPLLAGALSDEHLSHMARYALEAIPGAVVDEALRDALFRLDGALRIGVINSIARRGDREAVPGLAEIATSTDDPATHRAAVIALARLGADPDEVPDLMGAAGGDAAGPPIDARLDYAETQAAAGRPDAAARVYAMLATSNRPAHVRLAALRGHGRVQPRLAAETAVELLDDPDAEIRGGVRSLLADLPGVAVTSFLVGRLEAEPRRERRIDLIEILAARGDRSAAPAVAALATDGVPEIADAAVEALGGIGGEAQIELLATLAAHGREPAGASLGRLRGEGIDAAMASGLLSHPDPTVRGELARALGARRATDEIVALLDAAGGDADASVRLAALEALAVLAGPSELDRLAGLLVQAGSDEEREAAEDAYVAAAAGADDDDTAGRRLAAATERTRTLPEPWLLRALGRVGGPTAERVVTGAVEADDADVSDAAVKALASWPDATVLETLYDHASRPRRPTHRGEAFGGYVRAIALEGDRSPHDSAGLYRRGLEIAASPEEIELVLSHLAGVGHMDALTLAESYLGDERLRHEAGLTVIAVARAIGADHTTEALSAVDRVVAMLPDDEEIRSRAGEASNHIDRNEGFIKTWLVAGPFERPRGADEPMVDLAFAPETGGDVRWQPVPEEAMRSPGICDLNTVFRGDNRCAYLLATVRADAEQRVRLEIGSDDGVKVWLNDEVIHTNDVMRGLTVGQDTVDVDLKRGDNRLMLKVTQGGGDWQACCRLRSVEGFRLEGVRGETP